MDWRFSAANPSEGLGARRAFLAFLHERCTTDSDYYGSQLIFGELVSNVIRHARGPIDIRVYSDRSETLTLDVSDCGESFSLEPSLPAHSKEVGRGLYIVSRLTRSLSVTRLEKGNKVSAVLPVTAKPAES